MLVLALEFSRGGTARTTRPHYCTASGAYGASGQQGAPEASVASPGDGWWPLPQNGRARVRLRPQGPGLVPDGLLTPKGSKAVRHRPACRRAE